MNRIVWILLSIALFPFYSAAQTLFSGSVVDASSGDPLPGASISLPDLARQTITDEEGSFRLGNLPDGRFTVQVSFLGYKTHAERVDLSGFTEKHFALQVSLLEMREIIVTASASASEDATNSISTESISREELLSRPAANLVDAISHIPGVSQISSGPAVSKPVIRGLSYNRVLTVNNGIKQEGQQWGDEHGLEFDLYSADRVEILRGPASLLYGSDAMGGVINILDPIPLPEGELKGTLTSRYAGNNGLTGTSLMLEGNQNGLVWRGRGSYRNAYSYRTPAGYVRNTAFNERSLSGMVGLNKKWGYSHLNMSLYKGHLGFPDHAGHDHGDEAGHEDHADEAGHEDHAGHAGDRSRGVTLPMQKVNHLKLSLNNNFILGNNRLRVDLGFQQNERREFEHSPEQADIAMDLETWNAALKYFMAGWKGYEPVIGLSGTYQHNTPGGEELLIPAYNLKEAGAFMYLRKAFGSLSLNGGIRFDYRNMLIETSPGAGEETPFAGSEQDFSNFSGSLGLAWDMGSGLLLKANVGSAFRAPNISELASNGEHHGVERFEIGNTSLRSEQSFQLDASLGYASRLFGINLNVYDNTVYHYIYLRGMAGDSIQHEGEMLPVYRYTQANARLSGLEAELDLHPRQWLHIGSTFSLVRGRNMESGTDLPFIPAASWHNEIKVEPDLGVTGLNNTYFTLGLSSTFKQPRVDAAFERPAGAYHLLSAGMGTTLTLGRVPVSVFISGSNLFNVKYVSHMSRYRYLDIAEPGRNLQLGLHIPLDLN